MTRHATADPFALDPAVLEALAVARRDFTRQQVRTTRWFVLAGIVFCGSWASVGLAITMYTFAALGVLLLVLLQKGVIPAFRTSGEHQASAVADLIECDILQHVTDQVAPGMRVRTRSPLTAGHVRSSRLIRDQVDYVTARRSLSGVLAGDVPFCAGSIEAGKVVVIQRPKERPVTRSETVFRGVFLVLHHPGTSGWMTLEPKQALNVRDIIGAILPSGDEHAIHVHDADLDRLFTVRGSSPADADRLLTPALVADLIAFRREHGNVLPSIAFEGDVISVAIPQRDDCLRLRDNPATWPDELQHFADVARALAALLRTVHPVAPARLLEAAG